MVMERANHTGGKTAQHREREGEIVALWWESSTAREEEGQYYGGSGGSNRTAVWHGERGGGIAVLANGKAACCRDRRSGIVVVAAASVGKQHYVGRGGAELEHWRESITVQEVDRSYCGSYVVAYTFFQQIHSKYLSV